MSVFVRDIRRAIAQLIRDRALEGVKPEHVYTNRVRPYDLERMPAVCIFSTSETAELADSAPRINDCEVEIKIAVYIRTAADEDTDEDDILDGYLQAIRDLLGDNDTIEGNAQTSQYAGCDWILTNEGEYVMGAAILTYKVHYREEQPMSGGRNITPLKLIHVDTDGAPAPDGKIDARDDIRFEE